MIPKSDLLVILGSIWGVALVFFGYIVGRNSKR